MHAHDELSWEESFELNNFVNKVIFRQQVQFIEVKVLLENLKHYLLFGELFLYRPQVIKVFFCKEDNFCLLLHRYEPSEGIGGRVIVSFSEP